MDKIVKLLSLEFLKGSRLKISLVVAGLLGLLASWNIISPAQVELIVKLGLPFGLYFAVEHFEKK